MAPRGSLYTSLLLLAAIALLVPVCSSPPSGAAGGAAAGSSSKDRSQRSLFFRKPAPPPGTPKWGFFGTIFHLILEQVNDTKSAYNQINDLVSNQFVDDNMVTPAPDPANNGTTEATKISRAEFLKILDRNLKGLARLRALEWREAKKDTQANLRAYKDQIFLGKEHRNGR